MVEQPGVPGQPDDAEENVNGGHRDGKEQHRIARADELRQEGRVEERDLRVEQVREEALPERRAERAARAVRSRGLTPNSAEGRPGVAARGRQQALHSQPYEV